MTPEEKRTLLKRQMLKDAMDGEGSDDFTPADPPQKSFTDSHHFSPEETMARGAAQGLTFNTADQIEGALGALHDYFKDDTVHSMGLVNGLKEAYKQRQSQASQRYQQAQAERPEQYETGEFGGAVLAPVPSFLRPAAAAKDAMLVEKVGNAAVNVGKAGATGMLYGAGGSEHNAFTDTDNFAKDTAEGGEGGLAAGGVFEAAAPVLKRGGGLVGKKLGHVALGTDPVSVDRYLENPAGVKNADTIPAFGEKLSDNVKDTREHLSHSSGNTFRTLENTGILTDHATLARPLQRAIDGINEAGAYGREKHRAISTLSGLIEDVGSDATANNGALSLDRGKNLVKTLDSEIGKLTSQPNPDPIVLNAYTSARGELNDFLRNTSPQYADQMDKLAAETKALKGLAGNFRTEKGAARMASTIARGKDPAALKALEAHDAQFGTTFADDLKNTSAKEAFNRETTNGSRRAVTFGMAGEAIARKLGLTPYVGGAIGGAVGMGLDKYGGRIYQKILDGTLFLGKYTATLENAAKRGAPAVAVAHQVLLKNPEYRRLVEQDMKQEEQHQ